MPELRLIAVHVEEPQPGGFEWVLTERQGSDWAELQRAGDAVPRYRRAMADGLLALQTLVDDLDAGPRAAAPAPRKRTRKAADDAPPAAAARPYFGFGPAR